MPYRAYAMGLDSVELVLEVEERFGIKLADEDVGRVKTVADLAGLAWREVRARAEPDEPCPTSRSFYALRRVLVEHAGIDRARVRPGARVAMLLPFGDERRRVWEQIARVMPRLPALEVAPANETLLLAASGLSVLMVLGTFGTSVASLGLAAALVVSLVALASAVRRVARLRRNWATEVPAGMETVGDVVRFVSPDVSSERGRLLGEEIVLEDVRRMTAAICGRKLEDVRAESEFVKDLGMD
jgi:hypothetical protein